MTGLSGRRAPHARFLVPAVLLVGAEIRVSGRRVNGRRSRSQLRRPQGAIEAADSRWALVAEEDGDPQDRSYADYA
jgi:hypothetical protein